VALGEERENLGGGRLKEEEEEEEGEETRPLPHLPTVRQEPLQVPQGGLG